MSEELRSNGADDHGSRGSCGRVNPAMMVGTNWKAVFAGNMAMAKKLMAAMIVFLAGVKEQSRAADVLLEIEVNDQGDILATRERGVALEAAPIQSMPFEVGTLRLVETKSLIFAKFDSKDGSGDPWCCPKSGDWKSCPPKMTYFIDSSGGLTTDQYGDAPTHASHEIQALKSYSVAIYEDEDGTRYGMIMPQTVISPEGVDSEQSMWFNPDKFKSSQ
jgi:hypothetical protein